MYDASLLHDDEEGAVASVPVPVPATSTNTTSMKNEKQALGGLAGGSKESDPLLARILDATIGPALEMCTRVADLMDREREKALASAKPAAKGVGAKGDDEGAGKMDRAVFLINCAVYLQVCRYAVLIYAELMAGMLARRVYCSHLRLRVEG